MPENEASVTPLEGKTTIDDKMFFEPERLSYECAIAIAAEIVDKVKNAEINGDWLKEATIVLAGTQLLVDFANLQAAYTTLESLTRDYQSVAGLGTELSKPASLEEGIEEAIPTSGSIISAITAAIVPGIAPATALVNATLGLVSFFREDVEYHGIKTTIDPLAFEITLASQLKRAGAKEVIIPDLRVDSTVLISENSLNARLAKAQLAKTAAWAVVAPLITELVQLEAELEEVAREGNQSEFDRLSISISALRRNMQPISEPLSRCDQQLASLQEQWNKRDESNGTSALARMLRAETILAAGSTYLHAKVVSSGGHHRISRSLLRSIFVGDGLSFAGGATARWALLGKTGDVIEGGVIIKRANDASSSW